MLEKWSVGERVESIEEIPTVENSKTVACVAINGDETPSSSLNPKFIQEIYNRISKGNSAWFLYHFVDVSFLKGEPVPLLLWENRRIPRRLFRTRSFL